MTITAGRTGEVSIPWPRGFGCASPDLPDDHVDAAALNVSRSSQSPRPNPGSPHPRGGGYRSRTPLAGRLGSCFHVDTATGRFGNEETRVFHQMCGFPGGGAASWLRRRIKQCQRLKENIPPLSSLVVYKGVQGAINCTLQVSSTYSNTQSEGKSNSLSVTPWMP